MSTPLSDADLARIESRAEHGPDETSEDIYALLAEVRRLRADATCTAEQMRERAAKRVQALSEGTEDLGNDWDGGWEAAIEEAEKAIRALPTETP